jgi:predicted RNA binding protein YcfA (HicA-like mRNA interferase family)
VLPKACELVKNLAKAGFRNSGGKGGHGNFGDPDVSKPVTISGKLGDDAEKY